MSQIEELKVFVSERLYAAASEIFGAVEKTITDYEETVTRLKEENDRNRSLLDIILKTKSPPQKEDSQCSFTSRTDFLDFATNDNCRYCLKRIQATETHLTRKHYLFAVHFTECGAEKFVVPCTCKDLIQGRSHWHCPYCTKIIYRKCNFEVHISKQHGYPILQQSQNTEMDQPSVSAIEEDVPLSPAPWYQQELGSLDQEDQQASLLLHVKEEEEEEQETCRQVSHPEWQNSVHVKIEGEQMSVEEHHAQDSEFSIVCADSYIQDLSVESSKRHLLPNSSNQPLEMLPDSGVGGIYKPAEESQHTTPRTSLKALGIKRKVPVKRKKSNIKTSTLSVSQNPTGPHCCKACGKTFDYMYTLRTHVLTHAGDTIHICGICGKHLESMESFVQHIQSHTTRNKCGICGKQFSNNFRLKRHRRFHRPKGLNVMSST
ncbi:zinc finger protein 564-like isoform X2 [Cyclopterus lumpus]|uniref:zinc finger protein 564-like isoform X2 n=1 Tax=Cyclopterus lumpus TaxID=8103 RepID=UPI0014873549|nr:zinc finger protein 564-like isoform X2 [Cyclopterus lumpus]